jgi:alpha-glucosidase
MVRNWLVGLGFAVALCAAGCSSSGDSEETPEPDVQIVAADDGTVEVIAGGRTLFALAPTAPIARTFIDSAGNIGTKSFTRALEESDPLAVRFVVNGGTTANVLYASESRRATLNAVAISDEVSEFELEVSGEAANSWTIGVRCDEGGTFHGFGMQYNALNQRGEAFPLFVNEQGVGRDGSGLPNAGDKHTTYFPMPYYIDARGFGVLFDSSARLNVDLCKTDEDIAWFEVITGGAVRWRVFHGPTPLDVIRQLTDLVGRPTQPPAWAHNLWLASQGGTDAVIDEANRLEAADIPASAFWVQDWTGVRPNFEGGFGVQYLWAPKEQCNGPDDVCYPNFARLVSDFHDRGYKFLVYVNPFIVDPASVTEDDDPARFAERFDEMDLDGLLVKNESGETYSDPEVANIPQRSAHPDFSKTETSNYIRRTLAGIVTTYGVDGWMADFGEYIPFDSVHADGSIADERRNTFPVDWHRVNREALELARPDGDWVSFARSGFTNVQRYAQIHWVGDQQTDWGELDGLPTAIPALLNLGLAGQPFVSLDIAGFSVGGEPSTELYQRWTELGAFAPIMRTHQGAAKDEEWRWDNPSITPHFKQFTFVHCALKDDFMALAKEAAASGTPILRALMLEFPDDQETWNISDQFMIGEKFLVAPVVEQGATTRRMYFPEGTWFDVWSDTGESVQGPQWTTVDAPLFEPPVYSLGQDRDYIRNAQDLAYEDCR